MDINAAMLDTITRAEKLAQDSGDNQLAGELYALGCTLGSGSNLPARKDCPHCYPKP